jgi:hypothetical protein
MNRLIVLSGCVFLLFSGCQEPNRDENVVDVKVIIEGGGEFPQSLAGTWKDQTSEWQVTLAHDGKVVSLVNAIGSSMVIADEGFAEDGPEEGTFLCFVFGLCYTNYNPATRELGVIVTLEDFHMQLPDEVLEADMEYRITGLVSEDGNRWDAKLFNYISPKDGQPYLAGPEILVFNKVESIQPSPPKSQ